MAIENILGGATGFIMNLYYVTLYFLVPLGIGVGIYFFVKYKRQFIYDVEVVHAGNNKEIINDRGRIIRHKDGRVTFQLMNNKHVIVPVPNFDFIFYKNGKKHVKLLRFSEMDYAHLSLDKSSFVLSEEKKQKAEQDKYISALQENLKNMNFQFIPSDHLARAHLDEKGKPLFKATLVNMKNAYVNQYKAIDNKYKTGLYEKYKELIITGLMVVVVIVVVYMTLGFAAEQAARISGSNTQAAEAIKQVATMCQNQGATIIKGVSPPI